MFINCNNDKLLINVVVEDKEIVSITTINYGLFKSLFPDGKLSPSTLLIVGEILVKVSLNEIIKIFKLYVVP